MLLEILRSMRPKHWVKNLLVFVGVIFARKFTEPFELLHAVGAFIAFCFVSSSVYIVNDLKDRENDRFHPKKRFRPIASGRLTTGPAVISGAFLLLIGLLIGWLLDWRFGLSVVTYFLLQLAYSFGLKRMVVLDVMTVAAGFALRAISGTFVVGVEISSWLFVCAILLALFLALAKRRHELLYLSDGGVNHRSVLANYSETLLDQMIAVATSATVVTYCLYTIAPETVQKFGTHSLIFTVPFVLYGIYRYLYLVYRKEEGGAPEKVLFTDLPLLIAIGLWLVSVVIILFSTRHP
ncbi:MAG: decaprenyl-phosphate phosphoribosyltransferase [candidate division WOR-3 bacterium]